MKRLFRLMPLLVCLIIVIGALRTLAHTSDGTRVPKAQDRLKVMKTFTSEFVSIKPGTGKFPKPTSPLNAFAIAKYVTTHNIDEGVLASNPSRWKGPRNSAESMSHVEAADFCKRATTMLRGMKLITEDEEIRLPTEAEWEYACRAGTKTDYSFGQTATESADAEPKASLLGKYGWHHGNAAGNDPVVGALKPNPWGLYDMHGYLWEYVSDPWRPGITDPVPKPLPGSTQRTMRGGSWRDHYSMCKSSARWAVPDHVRSDAVGFRCVRAKVSK